MEIDILFLKSLTGNASKEELDLLEVELKNNPDLRATLEKLEAYWAHREVEAQEPDQEKIWQKLQKNTHPQTNSDDTVPFTSRTTNNFQKIYQYAAVLVIMFLSVALWWENKEETVKDEKVKVTYITKQNPVRLKRSLTLPDGTKVHLNSESKITYPNIFVTNRVVKLVGEAYFEVVPDKSNTFIVECYNTSTTVEGTSFNVRGYSNEETVKVSLVEGTVSVDFDEHGTISSYLLEPMQEATYNKNSGEVLIDLFDVPEVTSWKSGILYFKNASFQEVKSKIEKWYGVKVNLTNGVVPNWNISGEFHNETILNVLDIISHAENFEFTISDLDIQIKI